MNDVCDEHERIEKILAENEPADINSLEEGHPAKTLHAENLALEKFLDALDFNDAEKFCANFPKLNALHAHYAKKDFLVMPLLAKRGFPHPLTFMWQYEDEIKKSVRALSKGLTAENFAQRKDKIAEAVNSARDMIFKEENIFLPMALRVLTEEDWLAIYRDSLEMAPAFIAEIPRRKIYDEKLAALAQDNSILDGKIKFPTGELTLAQLQGIFKLLPIDITFIDRDDTIRFFVNEGKIFDRPLISLGNEIFACHPPQVQPVIKKLLEDFKAKKRSSMEVWRPIKGKPVSVKYFAVYDDAGEYIGAVEFVQEYSAALKKFAKE